MRQRVAALLTVLFALGPATAEKPAPGSAVTPPAAGRGRRRSDGERLVGPARTIPTRRPRMDMAQAGSKEESDVGRHARRRAKRVRHARQPAAKAGSKGAVHQRTGGGEAGRAKD